MKNVTNINQIIGTRIKEERKLKGLKQKDLEDYIEVDHATFSKIENAKPGRYFSIKQIKKISEILNVSVDYLIGNTDSKEIDNLEISRALKINDNTINILKSLNEDYEGIANDFFRKSPYEIWELLNASNLVKEIYNKTNSTIEFIDKCILELNCLEDYYPIIRKYIEPKGEIERKVIKTDFDEKDSGREYQLSQLLYYYKTMIRPGIVHNFSTEADIEEVLKHLTYDYSSTETDYMKRLQIYLSEIKKLYSIMKDKHETILDTITNISNLELKNSISDIEGCIKQQRVMHLRQIDELRKELDLNKEKLKRINIVIIYETTQKIGNSMQIE